MITQSHFMPYRVMVSGVESMTARCWAKLLRNAGMLDVVVRVRITTYVDDHAVALRLRSV